MSRRRGLREERRAVVYCALCTAEIAEGATLCHGCLDALTHDLIELADWLGDELETTVTGRAGGRLTGTRSAGGGDVRVNYRAREVQRALAEWLACGFKLLGPAEPWPADGHRISGMADHLSANVDRLARDEFVARLAAMIADLTRIARRLVDLPPDRQFLGECPICHVGKLYAEVHSERATCDTCRAIEPAGERRAELLRRLDDKLVTATEAAQLSTYLGLDLDRIKVRDRIYQWHRRGQIDAHGTLTGETAYRLGDVLARLRRDSADTTVDNFVVDAS